MWLSDDLRDRHPAARRGSLSSRIDVDDAGTDAVSGSYRPAIAVVTVSVVITFGRWITIGIRDVRTRNTGCVIVERITSLIVGVVGIVVVSYLAGGMYESC